MAQKIMPHFSGCMKAKINWIIVICLLCASFRTLAQGVAVNTTGAVADASAMLDVASTTRGMLAPRMTSTQRSAISSPATGLLVYQTNSPAGFYVYDGAAWSLLGSPAGAASGDLTGTYPGPTIAATAAAGGHVVNAINAGTSVINTGNLGTGAASSSTFLRGDGTWAAPASSTPKYMIAMASITPASLTTTSTGVADSLSFFGLGCGKNLRINVDAGSYIDPSGTLPDGAVIVPFSGTITSVSAAFKISDVSTPFLAIFGNYTLNMTLYYQPPPSGSVLGTAQFFPVPGGSLSVNLTSACSICIFGETICASASGLSYALAANSRLMVIVTLSSSTVPSSLQSLHGYASASVGMQ